MVQYKLIYFNSRGVAEVSRLLFKVANVEFEDVRLEGEEWQKQKPDMPLGALPVLEVDGKKYSQSSAIARFLARKFGLMGSKSIDELLINELHEASSEMFQRELMKVYYEQDAAKKAELAKTFAEGPMQKYMDFFEMRLKENNDGQGFYVGETLTLGDLIVYHTVTMVDAFLKKLDVDLKLSSRKLLVPLFQKVEAVPNIAKWLKERPTEM